MKFEEMPIDARGHAGTRRDFLRRGISLALSPLWLGTAIAWMTASAVPTISMAPPSRTRSPTRIDVRDKGARGDGQQDDTAAFQAAIDALPSTGGTVHVPAGTYMINAVQSVQLRSRTHLELAPDARLVAIPNAEKKAYVLYVFKVSDVEISGGQILGERNRHLGAEGEWGHGIQIRGASRVTVRDIRISDCWGDGVTIGGADPQQSTPSDDIFISNVVCTGNRRQGLSIGRSRNVRVYDSEFSNTSGTSPQCGIDIEPDKPGGASDIHIENCVVRDNHGGGIQIYKRVSGVTVQRCTIEGNGGAGILAVQATQGVISDNRIGNNGKLGVSLRQQSSNFDISGNHFYNNALRREQHPGKVRFGQDSRATSAVKAADDTQSINVTGNFYDDR